MYKNFRNISTILGIMLLIWSLHLLGCGGGSQSVGVSQVDKVGISSTVNGFFQSLRAGNPEAFFSPVLKSQTSVSEGINTLKIWDFGADINDRNDNHAHYFTIPENGINQISEDYAKVYAVKDFSGRTFRVDFELIKIDGQWFIETIAFSGNATDVVNTATLLPLQKGNLWKSIIIPANYSSTLTNPSMMIAEIPYEASLRDSRSVYDVFYNPNSTAYNFDLSKYSSTLTALKTTDSWSYLREAYSHSSPMLAESIRAEIFDLFVQPTGSSGMAYANDQGLYQYGTSNFNAGQPVKFLAANASVGAIATQTVTVQWSDGSSYQVFLATRLSRKISIQTFAGPFEAFQVDAYARFLNSIPSGQTQEMFWSRLYADRVGEVAQIQWDQNGAPLYFFLLYSATVNGTSIAPLDAGNTAPVEPFAFVADSPLTSAVVGETYEQQIVSGGKLPYSHRFISGSLPDGLYISGSYILGSPSTPTELTFIIEFSDYAGTVISREYSISVVSSGPGIPVFTADTTLPMSAIGSSYSQTLVSGGAPPYQFSVVGGTLPSGLAFSSDGISGTPDNTNSVQNYIFTIQAVDQNGVIINKGFQMMVGPELFFGTNTLLTATVGKTYDMPLGVAGGIAPITLSMQSGSVLPANITIEQSNKKLTGIPVASGTTAFTIIATDATGKAVAKAYSLEVVNNLTNVDVSTLPAVVFGVPYNQQLFQGGKPPYQYTFTSALPGGLSMTNDGYITGTTNAPVGPKTVTVSVVDQAANLIQDLSFTMTVVEQYAVAPSIKWQKVYGSDLGPADDYESAEKIIPANGGGYLVVGHVSDASRNVTGTYQGTSSTNSDVWVIKIDDTGAIQWQAIYGGNSREEVHDVIQDDNGNFIIVGSTNSTSGNIVSANSSSFDVFILSINPTNGGANWVRSYGGSNADYGFAVNKIVFPSPAIIVTGATYSNDGTLSTTNMHYNGSFYNDMWVLRIDPANGDITWQQAFGGILNDQGTAIAVDGNGNIFVAGSSASTDGDRSTGAIGGADVWVVKLDASSEATFGNLLGQYSFGGNSSEIPYSIKVMGDNSLLIGGETSSSDISGYRGSVDMYVIKMNNDGSKAWDRALGNTSYVDKCYDIQFLPDNSVVLAGYCSGEGGDVSGFYQNEDAWLVKLDQTGAVLNWQKPFGGASSEHFKSLVFTNGVFTAVGNTSSITDDLEGFKTDANSYDWWIVQFQ